MGLDMVNEQSTAVIGLSFTDETGQPVTPASARYRLDDVASDDEIVGWTDIAPTDASVDLIITGAQNVILDATSDYEKKRLTVIFTYGLDSKQSTAEYVYAVRNLKNLRS